MPPVQLEPVDLSRKQENDNPSQLASKNDINLTNPRNLNLPRESKYRIRVRLREIKKRAKKKKNIQVYIFTPNS